VKTECPSLKKEKKKFYKKNKRKGLLSTWDDSESSSSDEEETSEEAHIALMAKTDRDSEDESEVRKELSELEEAYEDLLKDSQVLITHCSDLKRKNEKLTFQLSEKDKIIQELSNKNLDLLEKNKSLLSQNSLTKSDSLQAFGEVKSLQQKVEELTTDLARFVKGTKNLKMMLRTNRHSHDKSGLGYEKDEKHTTQVKVFSKCSICDKYGHFANRCYHKKKLQASDTNKQGPKKIWVPKNLIIHVADILNRKKTTLEMVPGQ